MSWGSLVLLVAPPVGFFALAYRQRGFARQPWIVGAGDPGRFRQEVEKAGGPGAVRVGLVADLGFIATLTIPAAFVLSRSSSPWLVVLPVVAAGVDLSENLLLARALRSESGRIPGLLKRIVPVKYAAYAVTLVTACVVAARS